MLGELERSSRRCRTTSSRSSGTRTSSSGCSRGSSRSGSATSRAASWSGCSGSPATSRRTSSSAITSATATTSTATSRARRTRAAWSRSPTRSPASLGRPLTWIHLPVPRERARRGVLGAAARSAPARRDRALPGRCTTRATASRARGAASRSRAPLVSGSASRRRAAGAGCRPPPSPSSLRIHAAVSRPVADRRAAPRRRFAWPAGFARIPEQDWVQQPMDTFGLRYDTVENHGWYRNLDRRSRSWRGHLRGRRRSSIDYSGGTGILLDRLKLRIFDRQVGMLIVDSSPKFLRVALDKFRGDERIAFRLLRWLKEERRLELLEEVMGPELLRAAPTCSPPPTRSTSTATSTDTLAFLGARAAAGRRAFVQVGQYPQPPGAATASGSSTRRCTPSTRSRPGLVRNDARYAPTGRCSTTTARIQAHLAYRDGCSCRCGRWTSTSTRCEAAGFTVEEVTGRVHRGAGRRLVRIPRRLPRGGAGLGGRLGQGGRRSPPRAGRRRPAAPSSATRWTRSSAAGDASAAAGRTSRRPPAGRAGRLGTSRNPARGGEMTAQAVEVRELRQLIGGEWVGASGGAHVRRPGSVHRRGRGARPGRDARGRASRGRGRRGRVRGLVADAAGRAAARSS